MPNGFSFGVSNLKLFFLIGHLFLCNLWLGVIQEGILIRYVFKRDRTMCSKHGYRSTVNIIGLGGEDLDEHKNIFILTMNEIFIQALKIMRKVAMVLIRISLSSCLNCTLQIPRRSGLLRGSKHLRPIYLNREVDIPLATFSSMDNCVLLDWIGKCLILPSHCE